jgi:GntR family transcriptional regulator
MKNPLNPDTSIPYYEQIRTYLLTRIESGEFAPHTQIPSERSLSEQFGVSRMTVKHAIQELVSDGRLYTRIGKGTFVSDTPITQQLNTLTGFSEDMEKLGKTTSSVVLSAVEQPATELIARQLQITRGAPIIFLRRLRFADEQPVALENSYLNAAYCNGILDKHDFACTSLYAVLRTEYGLKLSYAEQNINARLATPAEIKLMNIEEGFPILHITRVTFNSNSLPIEFADSAYRGDRYIFRARLTSI